MILSTSTGRIKGWKLGFVKTSTGRIKGWKTGFVKMKEKMKNWQWKIEYQKWENEKFMHKQGCEDERAPTIL